MLDLSDSPKTDSGVPIAGEFLPLGRSDGQPTVVIYVRNNTIESVGSTLSHEATHYDTWRNQPIMRLGPEWTAFELRVNSSPAHPPVENRPSAAYSHDSWAYDPTAGLVPRQASDQTRQLSADVTALFDELWQSDTLPDPKHLIEVSSASRFSSQAWIGVTVPRYWRCVQKMIVAEYENGQTRRFFVMRTFGEKEGRYSLDLVIQPDRPIDTPHRLEPIRSALLYAISRAPRDENRRAVTFIEVFLDGPMVTAYKETTDIIEGLPFFDPGPCPERIEYDSLDAALVDIGIIREQMLLLSRRDPTTSLRSVLECEARIRGTALRDVKATADAISFSGAHETFEGVSRFTDLRDILRWRPKGF